MWDKSSGPVFFYTGNEGDIYGFQEASGFLSDLAAEMNALVVFAEHVRYIFYLLVFTSPFATIRIWE